MGLFCERLCAAVFEQRGGHVLAAGEAEGGGVEVRGQELDSKPAFRLDATEFGSGAMEEAMGLGAGAIYGLLSFVEQGIEFGVSGYERGFDGGRAAETPRSVEDC